MAIRKPRPAETEEFDRPTASPDATAAFHTHEAPVAAPKLKDFIREHEQAAQELGAVVAAITHPEASPGVYQGVYSGIRTFEGDLSATYSDGSKH